MAVLDHYEGADRLVLSQLVESIKSEEKISGDDILLEAIRGLGNAVEKIALDVPLTFPKCTECKLVCPGISRCQESHIKWFWKHHKKSKELNSNAKLFTPYTQRPVEAWLADQEDCEVSPSDALGANAAPLTARAVFLLKRLPSKKVIEVNPRISLIRIGRRHKLMKRHLKFHKQSIDGEKSRSYVIGKLVEDGNLFLYHQDQVKLVSNGNAFDALICALTAFDSFNGQVEPRPEGFPEKEAFIEIPL
jgi:hypothetical protein